MSNGVKPKYWAVIILVIIATGVGTLYYAHQPAPDLGPIVVHNKTASSTVEDLKNWKTYHNEKYDFEVRYPKNWEVADRSGTYSQMDLVLYDPNHDGAFILVVPNHDKNYSLDKLVIVNVNGYEAYSFTDENNDIHYIFDKKGGQLEIYLNLKSVTGKSEMSQILSTFKFTK